jgi:hypothetical protein
MNDGSSSDRPFLPCNGIERDARYWLLTAGLSPTNSSNLSGDAIGLPYRRPYPNRRLGVPSAYCDPVMAGCYENPLPSKLL